MSRVAAAQVSAFVDRTEFADDDAEPDDIGPVIAFEIMPKVVDYVWRRHLQAEARRRMLREGKSETEGDQLAVGFADLVGFTALSQQVPDKELARIVDRFEAVAYDTVVARGGRVVKMIGDEVMFSVEAAEAAAEIALTLADSFRADEALSDVRVGLAYGSVLEQEGDLYGQVVNLASRVVGIAYPGSVVVSSDFHDVLEDLPHYAWSVIRPHTLKHIGRVRLWRVRRPGDDEDESVRERARRRRDAGLDWVEGHFGDVIDDVIDHTLDDVIDAVSEGLSTARSGGDPKPEDS